MNPRRHGGGREESFLPSVDIRRAIADRVRQLGGDEEAIEGIAAAYAMWCTAFSPAHVR
ncbi:MAG: hypothetical protein U0Q47_11035 [Mycobacterium sp.]